MKGQPTAKKSAIICKEKQEEQRASSWIKQKFDFIWPFEIVPLELIRCFKQRRRWSGQDERLRSRAAILSDWN